jgi:glycerophosphoryl diester phosphodiesterase
MTYGLPLAHATGSPTRGGRDPSVVGQPAGPLATAGDPPPHELRYGTGDGPLALAHRGGGGLAPENTMAAFTKSHALGFRYLETDVRQTADGVCALFHDAQTRRLTGRAGRLDSLPWAVVRRLRVQGREPVARLEELLTAFPDTQVALDVKDPQAIGRMAAIVRQLRARERVCFTGTADHWLAVVRAVVGPAATTAMGWQSTARLVASARLGVQPRRIARAPFVHVPLRLNGIPVYLDRVVAIADELGARVVVWTVNDPPTMARLLDAGVAGLVTDRPDLLREVLLARGSWHPRPGLARRAPACP